MPVPWKRSVDAASAYVWCTLFAAGSDHAVNLGLAAVASVTNATFVPFCDSAICNHTFNNCTFWDEKGIGFVHGAGSMPGVYEPRSISDLIGGLFYYPVDEASYPMFPDDGFSALAVDGGVSKAIAEILSKATTILSRQIAVEMVNTDSIRTVTGAIIDTTVTMVAILAMATGHRELQGLLVKLSTLVGRGLCMPSVARQMSCEKLLVLFINVVVTLLTCAVIGASIVLAPVLTLAAEVSARENNPTPDTHYYPGKLGDRSAAQRPHTLYCYCCCGHLHLHRV